MDLLGAPTRVVRSRGARAVQAAAVAASMLVAAGAGGWPYTGGETVEKLVLSADADAPELPELRRSGDDRRSPLRDRLPVPSGPPVSTTVATEVVLVDAPDEGLAGVERAMSAYRAAADTLAERQPGCRLSWALLAGIGLVESAHGTVHGSQLDAEGKAVPPILGPRLDGNGFALIRDTDNGHHDGDTELDRAVGPMQFIPSTWARWGSDGDGDGVADPQDVDDAALAAGRYLCASGARLDQPAGLIRAVFSYNHSYAYVRLVLTVTARYLGVSPESLGVGRLPADRPPSEPTSEPEPEQEQPAADEGPPAGRQPSPGPGGPGTPAPEDPPAGTPSPSPPVETDPSPEPEPEPEPDPEVEGPEPSPCPSPDDPTCPPLPALSPSSRGS